MVEANEEGKQVEQEYGYHSYISPANTLQNLKVVHGMVNTTAWDSVVTSTQKKENN